MHKYTQLVIGRTGINPGLFLKAFLSPPEYYCMLNSKGQLGARAGHPYIFAIKEQPGWLENTTLTYVDGIVP